MRHEIKTTDNLTITMEIVIGGVGVAGLANVNALIFSKALNEWWDGVNWNPVVPASSATLTDVLNMPGLYEFDLKTTAYTADPASIQQGYLIQITEPVNNIMEYVSISLDPSSGVVDANVVDWGGIGTANLTLGAGNFPNVDASGGGTVSSNITEWAGDATAIRLTSVGVDGGGSAFGGGAAPLLPAMGIEGWGNNASAEISSAAGPENFPNLNVASYGAHPAITTVMATSAAVLPSITVSGVLGADALSSVVGMLDVNVMDWAGDTGSATHATIATTGGGTGIPGSLPAIGVEGWGGRVNADFKIGNAGDSGAFKYPNINVMGWGAEGNARLETGATSDTPKITVFGWEGDQIDSTDGAVLSSNEISVTWTSDEYSDGTSVMLPNVRTEIIKDEAIDEAAIKIDSVTYEEISDSAVREIVNGVWGANIISPIDQSADYSGDYEMASPGTMAHAMLVDYLSRNMIHISPQDNGQVHATSMHTTSIADSSGEKFYSDFFEGSPLVNPDEIKSYIDRTAVLFRGLSIPSGTIGPSGVVSLDFNLNEVDSFGDGWTGAQFKLYNSSGVEVASETLEAGFSGIDSFVLSEYDTYSWELSAAVWNTEVGFTLVRSDTGEVLVEVNPGDIAANTAGSGFFVIHDAAAHQQHLVRITDVGTDGDGQYLKIHLVDEGHSPVPGGIIPTSLDGSSAVYPGDILLIKAETDPTMHEVAHEVWEEAVADHSTPHTFGMFNRIMAGLTQYNHRITDATYDQSGRLLACRLKVFADAEDAKNDADPIASILVNSTYDEKQNMDSFVASEETLPPEE